MDRNNSKYLRKRQLQVAQQHEEQEQQETPRSCVTIALDGDPNRNPTFRPQQKKTIISDDVGFAFQHNFQTRQEENHRIFHVDHTKNGQP